MSMRRSTRYRRLIVAFLVVVVLAVAFRFARAAEPEGSTGARKPAPAASSASSAQIDALHAFHTTMACPDE